MENTTPTSPAHTPLPWQAEGPFKIHIDNDNLVDGIMITARFNGYEDPLPIARVTGPSYAGREDECDPELRANAEFIVRACNMHEDLLTVIDDLLVGLSIRIRQSAMN